MKRIIKKSLSIFLVVLMLFGFVPMANLLNMDVGITAKAAVKASGSCGPNATWTLDTNGKMVISGSGAITSHPWWEERESYWMAWWPIYKYTIKSLVIEDGITSICPIAFRSAALEYISFGNTLQTIGISAFEGCNSLKQDQLVIPESVKKISGASLYCNAKSIIIMNPLCEIVDKGSWDGDQEGNISFGVYSNNYRGTIFGYSNSTAQTYCETVNCTFLSMGNCIINDSNDEYIIGVDDYLVLEYDSLERIENANVEYDKTTLKIEKDDYYSVDINDCTLSDAETPVFSLIPRSTYSYISAVHCNGKDALVDYCSIGVSNTSLSGEAFNIKIYPDKYSDIASYELLQNGAVIQSNSTGSFLLDPRQVLPGAALKVRVVDTNGQKSKPLQTSIKTYEAKTLMDMSGNKISIKVPSNIPIIGGSNFSVDLSTLPIFVMATEDTVRIGIGASEKYNSLNGKRVSSSFLGSTTTEDGETTTSSLWQDWKKTVDDAVHDFKELEVNSAFGTLKELGDLKVESDSFMPKGDAKACAYAEFKIGDDGSLSSVDSNGILAVNMTVGREWQIAVFNIPFKIGLLGKIGAECDFKIGFDYEKSEWYTNSDFTFVLPEITGDGGPGIAHAISATAYATVRNTVKTSFVSKYLSCTLSGELGVSGKFFCFSGKKQIWKFNDWQYYYTTWGDVAASNNENEGGGIRSKKLNNIVNSVNTYNEDTFSLDERTHLETQSEWLGSTNNNGSIFSSNTLNNEQGTTLLQASIYEDANPQVVTTNDGDKVLTWIADIPERSAGNYPALVYSVYDSATSTWSTPSIVCDDRTADGYHRIATDGNEVYVTWVNTNRVFDDDVSIYNVAESCEINVAHFNKDTLKFENAIVITENEVMDLMPSIMVREGRAYLAYVENSDSNPLLMSGQNKVMYSICDNSGNISCNTIVTTEQPVYAAEIGFINNAVSIAYLSDQDQNIETVNDIEVFVVDTDSHNIRLTDNDLYEQNVRFFNVNDQCVLSYYVEGKMYYSSDLTDFKVIDDSVGTNYQFIDSYGKTILLYTSQEIDDDFSSIYASVLIDGNWSSKIKLLDVGQDIKYFSAYDCNGLGIVYTPVEYDTCYTDVDENGNETGTFSEIVDIYATTISDYSDLNLISIDYEIDKVIPGVELPIKLLIKNDGLSIISDIILVFNNEETEIKNCNIEPGEIKEVDANIIVPNNLTVATSYNVEVASGSNDRTPDNNNKNFKLGYTCLSASFAEYGSSTSKSFVLKIANNGGIATGCKVVFHKNSYDGQVVNSFTMKSIAAYSEENYYFDWNMLKKHYKSGDSVYVEVQSLKEEDSVADNYIYFVLTKPTKEEYEYDVLDDGTIKLSKYNGSNDEIIVPSEYDGYIVSSLGDSLFSSKIITVSIPGTISQISSKAFNNVSSLRDIYVDDDSIYFSSENGILFNKDKTQLVRCPIGKDIIDYSIPESVIELSEYAFYNTKLSGIVFSESLLTIGNYAFYKCRNITSINLKNVSYIGIEAFCTTGLTELTIPEQVCYIDLNAFNECSGLTTLYYNAVDCSIEHDLLAGTIFGRKLTFGSNIENLIIGENVKHLPAYAFIKMNITDIDIPVSVQTIGTRTFYNCSNIKTVNIELNSQLETIDSYAFSGDSKLSSINLPNSVTTIGTGAFSECKALREIDLPSDIVSIASNTFYNCSSLESIEIPEAVTAIGESAFYGNSALTSISIPNSVTTIGSAAFSGCNSLREIALPNNIVSINAKTFYNCANLEGIDIPETVTAIGINAFNGCLAFKKIIIGQTVETIGENAFANCSSLIIRCYNKTAAYEYAVANNIPYELILVNTESISINDFTIVKGTSQEIIYQMIPATSCENIVFVSGNEKIVKIEEDQVTALKCGKTIITATTDSGITATCTVSVIGFEGAEYSDWDYNLANDNTTITIVGYNGSDTDAVIPNEISGIPVTNVNSAFDGCNFENLTIGKNVISWTTSNCNAAKHLQNIYVDDENTALSSIDGVLFSKDGKTLRKYPVGRTADTYEIPQNVTTIGASAFSSSLIKEIRINENITSIGLSAFSNCSKLITLNYEAVNCSISSLFNISPFPSNIREINIGSNVEQIPAYLLKGCYIDEIIIPGSVRSINEKAFYDCQIGVIKSYSNSCAKSYAEMNGYNFIAITCGNCVCDKWTIITDSTCVTVGEKTGICSVCGATATSEVPLKEHTYGDWTITKASTCTQTGSQEKVCSACGDKVTETINALGHSYGTDWTIDKESTCKEEGSKSHHCTHCESKADVTVIEKKEHTYGDWNITKSATCTQTGTQEKVCSACGDKVTETINALGHKYSTDWTIDKESTCKEEGSKSHHCTRCDSKSDVTVIEKKEHTYVNSVVAPTCTTDGYTSHTCSVCGTSYTDAVTSKTGHFDDDGDGYCDKCHTNLGTHQPDDPSANCSCNCHKTGISKFFWKLINFFHKLFKMEKYHYCDCGNPHW